MFDLLHAGVAVQAPQAGLGGLAVGNHVGYAGGHAQVVLQHAETVVGAYDIGAADRHPGTLGRSEAAHFRAIVGALVHHLRGNYPVGDDAGLAVHVLQEEVKGAEPLLQPRGQTVPLCSGQKAGYAVDGDDALVGLVVPIDGKGDAFVGERTGDPLLNVGQFLSGEVGQFPLETLPSVPRLPIGQKHLVVDGRVDGVVLKPVWRAHGDSEAEALLPKKPSKERWPTQAGDPNRAKYANPL